MQTSLKKEARLPFRGRVVHNTSNAGGTHFGTGSVLCFDDRGNTYRVSIEEYKSVSHSHVSSKRMNVYERDTDNENLIKIYVKDYDASIHRKELDGIHTMYNKKKKIYERVSSEEFYKNRDNYRGANEKKVSVYDLETETSRQVTKAEFDISPTLVGITSKLAPLGKCATSKNNNKNVQYDLVLGKFVSISTEIYRKNSSRYVNAALKRLYVIGNCTYTNKSHIPKDSEYITITETNQIYKILEENYIAQN